MGGGRHCPAAAHRQAARTSSWRTAASARVRPPSPSLLLNPATFSMITAPQPSSAASRMASLNSWSFTCRARGVRPTVLTLWHGGEAARRSGRRPRVSCSMLAASSPRTSARSTAPWLAAYVEQACLSRSTPPRCSSPASLRPCVKPPAPQKRSTKLSGMLPTREGALNTVCWGCRRAIHGRLGVAQASTTGLIDSKCEGLLYSARTYVCSGGPANSLP